MSGPVGTLESALTVIGCVALYAMMLLAVGDALLRSIFNAPIFGANDYSQVILSFCVAIAIPLCVVAGRAIAIDTLVARLPAGVQDGVGLLVNVLSAAMLFYLAWRCYLNGRDAARFGETTLLLHLPFGPSYYALAAGCALSGLLFLVIRTRHES